MTTTPNHVTLTLTTAQAEAVRAALEWTLVRMRNGEDLPCVPRGLVLRILVLIANATGSKAEVTA